MNTIPTNAQQLVTERLTEIQAELDSIRAAAEAIASTPPEPTLGSLLEDPAVIEASANLARAINEALGIDIEIQASSAPFPVLTLPEQFLKGGGIGISAIVAVPSSQE